MFALSPIFKMLPKVFEKILKIVAYTPIFKMCQNIWNKN
jgi:hypothetical protein